jgi:MFS family permease
MVVIWVWGGINGVSSFFVDLVSISYKPPKADSTKLMIGYFLDLCWAQAFGLVATPLSNELGIPGQSIHSWRALELIHSEGRIGDLSTAFNTGLTIGAFTWGLLVDILGVCPISAEWLSS